MSLASTFPFVMNALHSFSANQLAWKSQSTELRSTSINYGSMALEGLHEALGQFSASNADAVLATSLIMSYQASDW